MRKQFLNQLPGSWAFDVHPKDGRNVYDLRPHARRFSLYSFLGDRDCDQTLQLHRHKRYGQELDEVIEKEAVNSRVTLDVNISKEPLPINVQKELLRMAFFTMLRNAVEITPAGGTVSVETTGDLESVTFKVSDSGPGISEEVMERIFDPSYSAKIYRFGMGMPLIKQIMTEHLGEIFIESTLGKGTTTRTVFPSRRMKKAP